MVFIIDSIVIAIITTALVLLPLSCKNCEPKVRYPAKTAKTRKRGIRLIKVKKSKRKEKTDDVSLIKSEILLECSICLDDIETDNIKKLACNHCFHIDCIDQWLLRETTCPMCRIEV